MQRSTYDYSLIVESPHAMVLSVSQFNLNKSFPHDVRRQLLKNVGV
jgi:hypothetical protein